MSCGPAEEVYEGTGLKEVGQMEQYSLERKERLKQLKRKFADRDAEKQEVENSVPKTARFRSYRPQDETLQENVVLPAALPTIAEEVQEQIDAATQKLPIEELDITNLAPRKPDWDLKRDCAKKLDKLELRTKQAIAELIRDRLKESLETKDDEPTGAERTKLVKSAEDGPS